MAMGLDQAFATKYNTMQQNADTNEFNAESHRILANKPYPSSGSSGLPAYSPAPMAPMTFSNIGALSPISFNKVGTLPQTAQQVGSVADYLNSAKPFSKGGMIRDPKGSPTKDTVPAKLADGEAVLNAGAAHFLGNDFVQKLNEMGLKSMGKQGMPGPEVVDGELHAAAGYNPLGVTTRAGLGYVPAVSQDAPAVIQTSPHGVTTRGGQGYMPAMPVVPQNIPSTSSTPTPDMDAQLNAAINDQQRQVAASTPQPVIPTQTTTVPNPATSAQQAALAQMGVMRERVVNPGNGMTLDSARVAQAQTPTDKFYQLAGYGDQNSIYASAGKDGKLNVFTGAGTGKASTGMPSPESVKAAEDAYQKSLTVRMANATPQTAAELYRADQARLAQETLAQDRTEGQRLLAEAKKYAVDVAASKEQKFYTPVHDVMGNVVDAMDGRTGEKLSEQQKAAPILSQLQDANHKLIEGKKYGGFMVKNNQVVPAGS